MEQRSDGMSHRGGDGGHLSHHKSSHGGRWLFPRVGLMAPPPPRPRGSKRHRSTSRNFFAVRMRTSVWTDSQRPCPQYGTGPALGAHAPFPRLTPPQGLWWVGLALVGSAALALAPLPLSPAHPTFALSATTRGRGLPPPPRLVPHPRGSPGVGTAPTPPRSRALRQRSVAEGMRPRAPPAPGPQPAAAALRMALGWMATASAVACAVVVLQRRLWRPARPLDPLSLCHAAPSRWAVAATSGSLGMPLCRLDWGM